MELDLDTLQQLPAEEEQATECAYTCRHSCPSTCELTGAA
ncbi:ALQxL family class IV lanthipeptide [Streptomyces sp. NPDC089919]